MNSVTIVGGGLAGLTAAVRLTDAGWSVRLLEARRTLGGRAGTFVDSTDGPALDHCQHVALGCCTRFLALCRQVDALDLFTKHSRIRFIDASGRQFDLAPTPWLPPPLHFGPALANLGFLSWPHRMRLALCLRRLARLAIAPQQEPTAAKWLSEQGQPREVVERFWSPVLVSALSETLDRIGLAAAQKVVVDSFYASTTGHELYVPRRPLSEVYDRVVEWLVRRGARVDCESPVREVLCDTNSGARPSWIVRWSQRGESRGTRETRESAETRAANEPCETGEARAVTEASAMTETRSDAVVVAVPWYRVRELLSAELRADLPRLDDVQQLAPGAITSVHLWFDRPITELPHAVLLDRLSQWLFRRPDGDVSSDSTAVTTGTTPRACYHQVVISAAHLFATAPREELVDTVVAELRSTFPAARDAKLVRARVLNEPRAVFSPLPGHQAFRPAQRTSRAGLALSGDWTATGWPATMEGAVRSGELAAEAITTPTLKT